VWTGAIGFIDDYLRVVKRRPKGLVGRYKLIGQMTLGLGLGVLLYVHPLARDAGTLTSIPFAKGLFINFGPLFVLLVALVVTGTSNAVNSDGIDGSPSPVRVQLPRLAGLVLGHRGFSDYPNIMYLECSEPPYCMAVGAGISLVQRAPQVFGGYRDRLRWGTLAWSPSFSASSC
jgi:phospho-N-acetylmuramoyl-pentapeptide-transferase